MKKIILNIFVILLSFISFQLAYANLVTNPFFTGTTTTATSWTSSATGTGAAFNHALSAANASITAAGGSTEFYSGCVGVACSTFPFVNGTSSGAQQTISTTIGKSYSISFWTYFSTANNTTIEIDVYWGSTKIYSGTNVPTAGWTQQVINLGVATSSSYVLTVLVRDDPSYSAITGIDIETAPNVTKTVTPICDPINGNTNPKMFPGSDVQYAITIANTGTIAETLTSITDTLPITLTFDTKLNSGALPTTNCVNGNLTNSLSSTGFAMHNGVGTGPGVISPGLAADSVTAGITVSGQLITINFSTLAKSGVVPPAAATLAGGNYITIYFNAFIN